MVPSLVTVGREYLSGFTQESFEFTFNEAFAKDNQYTLFRWEDWPAWVTFTLVFIVLISLDNVIMNRYPKSMTLGAAVLYTFFWFVCACCFCGWVCYYFGTDKGFMWMSGYMLEWMLSFDNLFVFHMIFSVYNTPDHLKHRPLYLGICGAVVFRLAFIFVGEFLMHAMFLMHFVFGSFLIYTGVKTATMDEDEEDPSNHPIVKWLQTKVPFIPAYDPAGRFFVEVHRDAEGQEAISGEVEEEASTLPSAAGAGLAEGGNAGYGACSDSDVTASAHQRPAGAHRESRATMLFLVLICLEVSDLLFAVDSVSAIVAQVNDLFLAYTSAVFAMLGLRAMFFIIDELAKLFSLLKYGVSAVLVFIGVKLIVARYYHVSASTVCIILVSCIALSMVASVVQDKLNKHKFQEANEESLLTKVLTPLQSPYPAIVKPRSTL